MGSKDPEDTRLIGIHGLVYALEELIIPYVVT